jgi:spermidine synthase
LVVRSRLREGPEEGQVSSGFPVWWDIPVVEVHVGAYLGIFLIAFATLALEVTLTRLLSVTTWYHMAFFAVSVAMLGMTGGATTVYLKPDWFKGDRLRETTAKACLGFALIVPLALLILCVTPVKLKGSAMGYYALFLVTLASMLPFYFSGVAITAVLTRYRLPIGKLYASDLIGASLGCLLVLGGLEVVDAPSLILICGLIGVPAALAFLGRRPEKRLRTRSAWVLGVLGVLVIFNTLTPYRISPLVAKGDLVDYDNVIYDRWNSFSRVIVKKVSHKRPQYWGASPFAPEDEKIYQHVMNIDGRASTTLRRFETLEDIEHLRFDVTNVAYYLRPEGGAFIVGAGAGRDIQSAIVFGHETITGVDINPIFIHLLEDEFRDFAGVADRKGVTLVVDDARSFLSRTQERYAIIQMSLIDTWAATGAGAFSLSENGLYTVEAWQNFIGHLADDGIFTVSRWYNPRNLGETGRLVSLATAALLSSGASHPADHIAMVVGGRIATLVVGRRPLSPLDVATLEGVCSDLGFNLVMGPRTAVQNPLLKQIVSAGSLEQLRDAVRGKPFNYMPPTDDSPYFFNMLTLGRALPFVPVGVAEGRGRGMGVIRGNLVATRTLAGLILSLLVLALVTVVFPLALRSSERKPGQARSILWSGAAYFSLIGAGFMFVEIALMQRLSVFLGHPMYALGVLLFAIIASAGLGSLLSERLPLARVPWVYTYPAVIAAAVIVVRQVLAVLGAELVSSSMPERILASVATIIPLGLLLGVSFPVGMRLVRTSRMPETPWYWALNGVFSVLCSALTVFISIYFSISTSLYVGAACYVLLLLCLPGMVGAARAYQAAPPGGSGD